MRLNVWLLSLLTASSAIFAQSPQRHVITRIAGESNQHYEVVSGPCVAKRCPISVELMIGDHATDRYSLAMESSSAEFEETKLQASDGFGDPSLLKTDTPVWRSGEDEDEMVLSVKPFMLEPKLTGILIDERDGFEHLKRHHVLLVARNNRMVELWHGSEGAGPTYSTVVPVGVSQDRESLLFYSFFDYPDNSQPDKLMLKSLIYDHASGSMVRYAQSLTALVIGPFPSIAAARMQRASHKSCAATLRVLPARGFRQAAKGYVLSTIASNSDTATALQSRLTECKFDAKVSLMPMNRDGINLW